MRSNEIEKGRVQQLQKKLDQSKAKLDWGLTLNQSPVTSWDDFSTNAQSGKAFTAIAVVIHDVIDFIEQHPGGKAMIFSVIRKDATAIFIGGVYEPRPLFLV
jgi:stearoyl-CoA desaturase (delta-9 desaturase)